MADRAMAEYVRTKCNFDYPDLFKLEADKSVFSDYGELDKDKAQLIIEIDCLKKMVEDGEKHRKELEDAYQQLLNSSSWKMTSFLRKAKSALRK